MIATSFFSAIPDKGILHVLRVLFGHLLCRHRVQKRHVTAGVPKGYASLSLTQARTHVAVVRTRTWSEHIPYCRLAKGTIVTSIFCKSPCPSQRPDAASPALTVCPLVMGGPDEEPRKQRAYNCAYLKFTLVPVSEFPREFSDHVRRNAFLWK